MDNLQELEQISNKNRAAMINILWGIITEANDSISKIYKMVSAGNIALLPEYVEKLVARKPHYRQAITVDNIYIDIILQRYMLESVMNGITVDYDVDSLGSTSDETSLDVANVVKKCFGHILALPNGAHVFLTIKASRAGIVVEVTNGDDQIFSCEVAS